MLLDKLIEEGFLSYEDLKRDKWDVFMLPFIHFFYNKGTNHMKLDGVLGYVETLKNVFIFAFILIVLLVFKLHFAAVLLFIFYIIKGIIKSYLPRYRAMLTIYESCNQFNRFVGIVEKMVEKTEEHFILTEKHKIKNASTWFETGYLPINVKAYKISIEKQDCFYLSIKPVEIIKEGIKKDNVTTYKDFDDLKNKIANVFVDIVLIKDRLSNYIPNTEELKKKSKISILDFGFTENDIIHIKKHHNKFNIYNT